MKRSPIKPKAGLFLGGGLIVLFVFFLLRVLLPVRLPAAEEREDPAVYVTNSGKRYHRETCRSLRLSRIALPLTDAVRSGYEPCSLCDPPRLPAETPDPEAGVPPELPPPGPLYRVHTLTLRSVSAADPAGMVPAEVIDHIDGDTVRVRIPGPPAELRAVETIRMIGVDTPETVHPRRPVEFFGREASEFTKSRLLGQRVALAFDWDLRDRYGRLLAYIYTADGDCFNAALIREGYAHAYTRYTFQFMEEFRSLEQQAREDRRGLWGD
jgi:micrococcal nuclease